MDHNGLWWPGLYYYFNYWSRSGGKVSAPSSDSNPFVCETSIIASASYSIKEIVNMGSLQLSSAQNLIFNKLSQYSALVSLHRINLNVPHLLFPSEQSYIYNTFILYTEHWSGMTGVNSIKAPPHLTPPEPIVLMFKYFESHLRTKISIRKEFLIKWSLELLGGMKFFLLRGEISPLQ